EQPPDFVNAPGSESYLTRPHQLERRPVFEGGGVLGLVVIHDVNGDRHAQLAVVEARACALVDQTLVVERDAGCRADALVIRRSLRRLTRAEAAPLARQGRDRRRPRGSAAAGEAEYHEDDRGGQERICTRPDHRPISRKPSRTSSAW